MTATTQAAIGSGTAGAKRRTLDDLPHPRGVPWFGNLFQLTPKTIHARLEAWAKEFGPYYTFRIGPKRIFVTSDTDTALTALKDRPGGFRRLATIESVAEEMGINGAFSVEGKRWRPQRDLVMRGLAPHQLESFFPTLQTITERLHRHWQKAAEEGAVVDILKDMTRFTVDTTATLVFGSDVNTIETGDDDIQRHLGVILPKVNFRVNAIFPYWRYIKFPKDMQLDRSLKAVRIFADEMIARARDRMRKSPDIPPANLLEAMLARRDEPNSGFTDDDVYANIITLLLAGEDTTAYSLAWTMHLLAGDPKLQEKLRAEAHAVLGPDLVPKSFADTAKLALFEGTAFEVMRMKPVTPMGYLEPNADTELAGIAIPKGTAVFVLVRPAVLDNANYHDAGTMVPERWVGKRESNREGHNTRAFLQFGAGPRFCPGRYLATLEMKMVLAMLMRNFTFEHAEDPARTKELFAFTMMPSRLRMRLRPASA